MLFCSVIPNPIGIFVLFDTGLINLSLHKPESFVRNHLQRDDSASLSVSLSVPPLLFIGSIRSVSVAVPTNLSRGAVLQAGSANLHSMLDAEGLHSIEHLDHTASCFM